MMNGYSDYSNNEHLIIVITIDCFKEQSQDTQVFNQGMGQWQQYIPGMWVKPRNIYIYI